MPRPDRRPLNRPTTRVHPPTTSLADLLAGDPAITPEIASAVLRDAEQALGGPCRVCGAPSVTVGVWRADPETTRLFGRSSQAVLVQAYGLCADCVRRPLPELASRVENAILAELGRSQ